MAGQELENENDRGLLAGMRAGSDDAFSVLLERHTNRYYSLAFRYLADKNEAEDVVQDCFIKIWVNPTLWKEDRNSSFKTWFYTIVINACMDRNRKRRTFPLPVGFDRDDGQAPIDTRMNKRQEKTILEYEIARLPYRQRTALNLCFYEELSNKDAAEIMGLNIKALQSLLMRAKTTLKKKMTIRNVEAI